MTFDTVTGSGTSSLTESDTGTAVPDGFQLGLPTVYFDISTTATFTGSIEVCISYAGITFVGTAHSIADEMQQWLEEEGSDGFNIMFPWLPGGLDDFVAKVVPELQGRGIFRREYEGSTLRENLGLPRPANRYFHAG